MILALKILVIMVCSVIIYQDFKDRAVIWLFFPILAVTLFFLHLFNVQWEQLIWFATINLFLVTGVVLILFLYSKLMLKMKFINVSFGLGDLLFFYALAVGFPTITFVIIFVGAILFSLFVTIVLRSFKKMETVPLAGLMGIYLIGLFLFSFCSLTPSLYF